MTKDEQIQELKYQLRLAIQGLRIAERGLPGEGLARLADAIEKKVKVIK